MTRIVLPKLFAWVTLDNKQRMHIKPLDVRTSFSCRPQGRKSMPCHRLSMHMPRPHRNRLSQAQNLVQVDV